MTEATVSVQLGHISFVQHHTFRALFALEGKPPWAHGQPPANKVESDLTGLVLLSWLSLRVHGLALALRRAFDCALGEVPYSLLGRQVI